MQLSGKQDLMNLSIISATKSTNGVHAGPTNSLSKFGMVIFLVAWAGLVLLLPSIHQVGYLLTLKTREGLI